MGSLSLVLFPLVIMFVVAMLSSLGLGVAIGSGQTLYNGQSLLTAGFYDSTGHKVATSGGVAVGEVGNLTLNMNIAGLGAFRTVPSWVNATNTYDVYDEHGVVITQIDKNTFSLWGSAGWLALLIAVMAGGALAGFHFLGSGENVFSTQLMVVGGAFLTIWTILSVLALPLIVSIPVLGVVGYGFMTFLEVIGIVSFVTVGGGGGGAG